ncbi:MAG: HipA domain-containing protein [Pirellulaceae bacterium]|nr:HipA domain-containing protein [Pirellulaceae bacterium]
MEAHSAIVRQFFENLLPEGDALDQAAHANGVSKSNLVGLMVALGRETAGAIRVTPMTGEAHQQAAHAAPLQDESRMRLVTATELSERIRDRTRQPFSVWDGKVRLSIAGFQDKIAVYEHEGQWFLVDDPSLASTVIVKPVPIRPQLASLPGNEFMCMQLAEALQLAVAETRLVHVPEPVLLVRRFDRRESPERVERLHVIDGCQALGLSVGMKYERPYGDGRDVRHVRDGASYPRLFELLEQTAEPVRYKLAFLRWAIFQVLIGNTDAHAKNVSFFCSTDGLRLAPAYDLVNIPALLDDGLSHTFAMAIGDAFSEADLTAFEWAYFAWQCDLDRRMVARQLSAMSDRTLRLMNQIIKLGAKSGIPSHELDNFRSRIEATCVRQSSLAPAITSFKDSDF